MERIALMFSLWLDSSYLPKLPCHSPPQVDWGHKRRHCGSDEDREVTQQVLLQANSLRLGKLVTFISKQIRLGYWEINTNLKHFLPTSFFFLDSTYLAIFPYLLSLSGPGRWGFEAMVSSPNLSVVASSSLSLPALVCGPPQGRQSPTDFSIFSPSHRL